MTGREGGGPPDPSEPPHVEDTREGAEAGSGLPTSGARDGGEATREARRRRRSVREERLAGRRPGGGRRVPAWVVIPLAVAAGGFVSSWAGAVFGLVVGLVLWWSRR